jgi:hypothetical protein
MVEGASKPKNLLETSAFIVLRVLPRPLCLYLAFSSQRRDCSRGTLLSMDVGVDANSHSRVEIRA